MPLPSAPFNAADSIINGLSVLQFSPNNTLKTGTTIALTTGLCTSVGHGLKVNHQVQLKSITGGTGLTVNSYYWVISAPTADTFTISATRGGTLLAPSVAATAFTMQLVHVFEVPKNTDKGSIEEKTLPRPDFSGMTFDARSFPVKATEETTMDIDDVKRLLLVFNGSKRGRLSGKAIMWRPDIDDPSGKCAEVSEEYPATLTSDGDMSYGGGDATKAQLKLKSNKVGMITFTSDATV